MDHRQNAMQILNADRPLHLAGDSEFLRALPEADDRHGDYRARDAEQGRVQTEAAREVVEEALNRVLDCGSIAPEMVVFLREAWSRYLVLVALRAGVDTPEWLEGIAHARYLVDATRVDQASAIDPDPEFCQVLIDGLLSGLRESGLSAWQIAGWQAQISDVLQRNTDNRATGRARLANQAEATGAGTSAGGVDGHVATLDDPVAPKRLQVSAQALLDGLAVGSCIEVRTDPDRPYRVKLAAIIRSVGKYIFVNQLGVRTIAWPQAELLDLLKAGSVEVVEDGRLFDRALDAALGSLRG